MALGEVRARLRRQLEETYGVEGAAILMDRPPGGWSDLVTNHTLDLKIDALRHELIARSTEGSGRRPRSPRRRSSPA